MDTNNLNFEEVLIRIKQFNIFFNFVSTTIESMNSSGANIESPLKTVFSHTAEFDKINAVSESKGFYLVTGYKNMDNYRETITCYLPLFVLDEDDITVISEKTKQFVLNIYKDNLRGAKHFLIREIEESNKKKDNLKNQIESMNNYIDNTNSRIAAIDSILNE